MKKDYWWASEDPKDIASEMENNHRNWQSYGTNPVAQAWFRNTVAYYSAVLEPDHWETSLAFLGEQGELVKMVVPQARAITRQITTLATKQRLAFAPIAETKDVDTSRMVKIAKAEVNNIVKEQKLDIKREILAEQAQVYGMSFWKVCWRTDKGEMYAANPQVQEDGSIIPNAEYKGAIEIENVTVFDIAFDAKIPNFENQSWVEVRTLKNRYDLIAQFPDLADNISSLPAVYSYNSGFSPSTSMEINNDDLVWVWEAYHRPSPALPEGRMVIYSDTNTIYHDGINVYGCIPVVAVIPETVFQTGYGYPMLSSLLPAQEMFDNCLSMVATNQSTLGIQSVLIPRGAEVELQDLGNMNAVYYTPQNAEGGGKPEPMQLTQSSPETFKYADFLNGLMTGLSNLNSTIRGTPPPGLTSGTAIATMSANAYEFLSSLTKGIDLAVEAALYMSVKFTAIFGVQEREISVPGSNNKTSMETYQGKELEIIKGLRIIQSNPLMQSLAGRLEIADKLMSQGLIKDVQQFFGVLEGAPVETLYEDELSEEDLIRSENEMLSKGQSVLIMKTDDHPLHIRKHAALLNDPVVRSNGQFIQMITDHLDEHDELARITDPFFTAMVRTGKMPEGGPPPPPQQNPPPDAGLDQGMAPPPGLPAGADIAKVTPDQLGRAQ